MKYLFTLIIITTLPSLVHATELNATHMATPSCETYIEWTGKNIDEIDLSILKDRAHRVLKPGSMMTMDYLPNRLNIHTTDEGIVVNQDCG